MYNELCDAHDQNIKVNDENNKLQRDVDALINDLAIKERELENSILEIKKL